MTITEPESAMEYPISSRCNGDEYMLTLYDNCVECIKALGLKATYYGREAGGKTLALYDTDPPINDATGIYSCQVNYTEIWLDDWYVYGSEADGRIATVDPKEVIEGSGKRMTGSEFLLPVNMVGSPIDTLKVPIAMRERGISGVTGHRQTQQRTPDFRRYEIKDHLGNVRTVIADYKNPDPTTTSGSMNFWKYFADIKNISNMYPYGKSYGTNAIYNASDDYRYGFNGMEKEKNMDASGDITDFGARVFDSEFPIFARRDDHEMHYPGISPYSPFANNPILHIDPTGKDYTVYIDHTKGSESIVIKATYYTIKGDMDSKNSLQLGIDKWLSTNGQFTYEVETQTGIVSYNIRFEIEHVEIDKNIINGYEIPPTAQLNYDRSTFTGNQKKIVNDNSSNSYKVTKDDDPIFNKSKHPDDNAGMSRGGVSIYVKESYSSNSTVSTHELGHNFGLNHIWRTIMQSDLEKSNPVITKSVINAILIHAGIKELNTIISNINETQKPKVITPSGQKAPEKMQKGEVKEQEK
ncbi:MAG: hypothetical protein CVV25_09945 [Ignavibacteriae bacterium HGW-Ignavibacteriae-4]|jgi:RHS repeat-associated protein|nr:MAG: hypothetical protein CVV25_09945 [Ignavibacteriae bacterium HGW-Ignavibacteriae-4]